MSTAKRFKGESTSVECLPNELFVEIFGYLNGVDAVYAFSQLNIRLQNLLNNYVVDFDFQSISKMKFTCILQVHTLEQCRSLRLSDDDKTPGQIELFCQLLSFPHRLSQLEYLSVLNMSHVDAQEFLPVIPLLKNLTSLSIDTLCGSQIKPFVLPTLKNLTFTGCQDTLWLKNFENLETLDYTITYDCTHTCEFVLPNILKRLKIFYSYTNDIDKICDILLDLSQLNTLALYSTATHNSLPNGRQWEDLIVSHLPFLNTFQFYFRYSVSQNMNSDLNEMIRSYSTPFYLTEKRWFIRCDRDTSMYYQNAGVLYSLPYAFSQMPINISSFDASLSTLPVSNFDETKSKYYQKIRTLTFNGDCKAPHLGFLSTNIQHLILSTKLPSSWLYIFSNLRHLTFIRSTTITSVDFENILRHSPKLNSLTISGSRLQNLTQNFKNQTICQYLSERIRSLTISREYLNLFELGYVSVRLLISIVRLFSSNCEHLSLALVAHPNTVRPILRRMKKLRSLHLEWQNLGFGTNNPIAVWLNQQQTDKDHLDLVQTKDNKHLFIWFGN